MFSARVMVVTTMLLASVFLLFAAYGNLPGLTVMQSSATLESPRWKNAVLAGSGVSIHEIDGSVDALALEASGERPPIGRKIVFTDEVPARPIVIAKRAAFTIENIEDASAGFDRSSGRHFIDFKFSPHARQMFSDMPTKQPVSYAVVLDGIVVSNNVSFNWDRSEGRIFGSVNLPRGKNSKATDQAGMNRNRT